MKCPNCLRTGPGLLRVVRTERPGPEGDTIRRWRRCTFCGAGITTVERVEESTRAYTPRAREDRRYRSRRPGKKPTTKRKEEGR